MAQNKLKLKSPAEIKKERERLKKERKKATDIFTGKVEVKPKKPTKPKRKRGGF